MSDLPPGPIVIVHHPPAQEKQRRRWLLIDRDGVLIENRSDYVRSVGQVRFIERSLEALRAATSRGLCIAILTNQEVVGRNLISAGEAVAIQRYTAGAARDAGARVDVSCVCPHAPGDGCWCRKPRPGLVDSLRSLGVRPSDALLFVGDAWTDIGAAEARSIPAVFVRTGRGADQLANPPADRHGTVPPVADDLWAAVSSLLTATEGGPHPAAAPRQPASPRARTAAPAGR